MIEAMPPSMAKPTRCRAVSPPKVLMTSTASKSALTPRSRAGSSIIVGGPEMAPHAPPRSERPGKPVALLGAARAHRSSWGGPEMAPHAPPTFGARPGNPWRFSARAGSSLAQLTLSPSRGEDALRAEDHHEDEDEAEDHPLVLGGLELRGQAR